MHKLINHIPEWMKPYLSQNPQEKTWECPTCGVMAPIKMLEGWYLRRRCACEERAEEQRRRQGFPQSVKEAITQTQITQTYSWLGPRWQEEGLEEKTFATFERSRQAEGFDRAQAFALHPQGTLALSGAFGLGKTHLLAAIANHCRENRKPCLFVSAARLFDAISERISTDADYHDLIKRAITTPLLLLDDIDKPKSSLFRQEIYYQIIDGRTRAGRPLAFSANASLEVLEHYLGGATRSRLMMGLVPVQMRGKDYRIKVGL